MELQIIDYYNETPECFKTIEKLNDEFNQLQNINDKLKNKLDNYLPIRVYYSNKEWLNKTNEFYLSLEKGINQIIINDQGYLEVYNQYRIPCQIHFMIENALNILTKQKNKKWCRNIPHRITLSLDAFIKSMTLIPCQGMCNEMKLSELIYKNIEYQFNEILDLIPKFI